MARKQNPSFEESFQKLTEAAEALRKESATLEDALNYFEEGTKYFRECSQILDKAKQRVLKYDRETETTEEML